jgi:Family of unknown function (DUF5343)
VNGGKSMKKKNEPKPKPAGYPFVTPQSMAEMMEFICQPDWKMPVNVKLVEKLKIATNNEPKVVGALRFLGVIDTDGIPTGEFDALKKNYKPTLKRLVQEKYADLLTILPPRMMTLKRLKGFFGDKQTDERRVRFFVWLCQEAGIELPNLELGKITKKPTK